MYEDFFLRPLKSNNINIRGNICNMCNEMPEKPCGARVLGVTDGWEHL